MSRICSCNKKCCTKIEPRMRKPPGCYNIFSATLTVRPFLAELDCIHRSCWLCLDWWGFSSCPWLLSGSQVGSCEVKEPCKIGNGCQSLAVSCAVICVRNNSIQQYSVCPYRCLDVSEDSLGRNMEFGDKLGANRSLVPLLFWPLESSSWCGS